MSNNGDMEYLMNIMLGHEVPNNESEEILHYVFVCAFEGMGLKKIITDNKFNYDNVNSLEMEYILMAYSIGQAMHLRENDNDDKPINVIH